MIHCYQSLFSPQRVLVLPYELLLRDSTAFLSRIGDFADADLGLPDPERQKPSLSAAALYAERHGNRLFALTGLNPAPMFQIENGFKRVKKFSKRLDRRLPDQIKKKADDRWRDFAWRTSSGVYGESNSVTARLTGLDFETLGYEMHEPRDGGSIHPTHRA